MKTISIISSCYNEEKNLWELYERVSSVMDQFPQYNFEHLLADNGSTDHTSDVLRAIALKDARFKIIFNARNFGADRSGYHVFRQAMGDCVIGIVSDLQEPPELIADFIAKWEAGYKIVIGVKNKSKENPFVYLIRKQYYRIIRTISDVEMIDNFSGFALYDRVVADILTSQDWPPPYIRGMVCEIGFEPAIVCYTQDKRKNGKSSYSFLKYFEYAMNGITSYSKIPLRLATLAGSVLSGISLLIAIVYLILKLTYWYNIPAGIAPLVIGLFFFSSVQILFIGLVGEYVLQILEHVRKKPLVVEQERIGFEEKTDELNK